MNKPIIVMDGDDLPEGAVAIHLYNVEDVLKPRGSMEKESIGAYLLEKLESTFEHWTHEKYGDNPPPLVLMKLMHDNLMSEVQQAWNAFVQKRSIG